MRIIAAALALLLACPGAGAPIDVSSQTLPGATPITITAPRLKADAERTLRTTRAAGAGVGAAGVGLMAYCVAASAAGPFAWAAALILMGGMTAYLSHRRLKGEEDFSWSAPKKSRTAGSK